MFRLAHVSDVHLPNVTGFWPRHWNLKRGLGFINWQRKRRFIHRKETIDLLLNDLKDQQCDHIAVSGDLANIGLPSELEAAAVWLGDLGTFNNVSVVPGNHDIYCPLWSDIGTRRWADYMVDNPLESSRLADIPEPGSSGFPYVRRFGSIALIGVNSAVPTAPGIATGRIGVAQLEQLKALLLKLGAENCCRVVMIHHPPLPGQATSRRCLLDAEEMQRVLQEAGAELVFHGHNHRDMLASCDGRDGPIPVVGVPSFSATPGTKSGELAAYNIYEISGLAPDYSIVLKQRGFRRGAPGVLPLRDEQISRSMHKQT